MFKGQNGKTVKDTFIKPKMRAWTQEVTAKYPVTDVFGDKRQELNEALDVYLKQKFEPYGIIIDTVNFTNIQTDAETSAAIQKKVTAQQELELANIEARTAKVQADKDKQVALIEAEKNKEMAEIQAEQAQIKAEGEAEAKRISSEAEAAVIDCDARLISRAIGNLVQNSINHNPQGCDIFLSLVCSSEKVSIIVADNGVGMSVEKLRELEEKPHYMESTDERLDLRHGLGLLLVRQIVEAHGGTIEMESTPQNGYKTVLTF